MSERHNIHATGLVLGGLGVLLRGPSGSGKSLLALELLADWEARGSEALLVADDRVEIAGTPDGLEMRLPSQVTDRPDLHGKIELRGLGIVARPHVPAAPLHLVVDLVDVFERMVAPSELRMELFGIELPRAPVPRAGLIDARHQILLIREALQAAGAGTRQKTT